jgi:hypothetical protein
MCEYLHTAGVPEIQKLLKYQHGNDGIGVVLA